MSSTTKDFRFRTRLAWVDTDAAKIAHFTAYLKYVERAEEELYNSLGLNYAKISSEYNASFPKVEVHCRYLSPCRFNDLLEIILRVAEIKEKSVKTQFSIHNLTTTKLSVEGYITSVTASPAVDSAVSLPKEFVAKMKEYFALP